MGRDCGEDVADLTLEVVGGVTVVVVGVGGGEGLLRELGGWPGLFCIGRFFGVFQRTTFGHGRVERWPWQFGLAVGAIAEGRGVFNRALWA